MLLNIKNFIFFDDIIILNFVYIIFAELERRRGNGLKDKDDHKLFEMLYANMQIMLENTEVLHELTHNSVGLDNEEMTQEMHEAEGYEMDVSEQQKQQTVSRQNNSSESEDSDHQ